MDITLHVMDAHIWTLNMPSDANMNVVFRFVSHVFAAADPRLGVTKFTCPVAILKCVSIYESVFLSTFIDNNLVRNNFDTISEVQKRNVASILAFSNRFL